MKYLSILFLSSLTLFVLSGCGGKPPHHPKNPRYEIHKPAVKYKPSKKNLAKMVTQLQGSPYVWAEEGPNQFDCSGFTYYMYGSMGLEIPRTARAQARVGKRVPPSQLQYGDLIFFATNKHNRRKITHVGMYLGEGWFTHASTVKNEVIYSNLFTSSYYQNKLRICRRYLPEKTNIRTTSHTNVWEKVSTVSPQASHKAIVIQSQHHTIERKGIYYIQVGSFVDRPDNILMSRIQAYRLPYKMIQYKQQKEKILKVLIGPYARRKQALSALSKIRTTIENNAFIAEIR